MLTYLIKDSQFLIYMPLGATILNGVYMFPNGDKYGKLHRMGGRNSRINVTGVVITVQSKFSYADILGKHKKCP